MEEVRLYIAVQCINWYRFHPTNDKGFAVLNLIFLWLLCIVQAAAQTAQEQYDLGQKFMDRGNYTKAVEYFNIVRNYYRDDPLAQMAELAIADVYFKKTEWDLARYSYDDFRRRYPRHEKVDYATYQIGMTLYKKAPKFAGRDQKWTAQAIKSWTGFEKQFPESVHLEEVLEKRTECTERLAKKEFQIAEFYAKRGAWEATRRRSAGLLEDFPSSEYTVNAKALQVQSLAELGEWDSLAPLWKQLQIEDPDMAATLSKKYESLQQ